MGRSPRRFGKAAVVTLVTLCAFGLFESLDAVAALFRPVPDSPMAEVFDYPVWSLTHFIPGALFMTLAPFQLWAGFRNRHRTGHRWSGRLVVTCALLLGVSGLAFPFTMSGRPPAEQLFMTVFGIAFLVCATLAFNAARRRDFATHRRWMIRLVITGLTITTQRLLLGVFIATRGIDNVDQFWRYFVAAAWVAWVVQAAVAEWWIRRHGLATRPGPSRAEPQAV
jgi:hypothetical protein